METYLCHCANDLLDCMSLRQALADPRRSQELMEFTKEIVHTETSSLLREHNDVIRMQQENIAFLNAELKRARAERMDAINAHAAEIQTLHGEYAQKLRQAASL